MPQRSFRAAYAKHILHKHLVQKKNRLLGGNDTSLPPASDDALSGISDVNIQPDPQQPICIVGAGPTGLAVAITLEYLGFKNIWVLEAASRVGGRIYTHNFAKDENCPHNYYDAGAMRIPDIATQQSTLSMINYLESNGYRIPLASYTYSNPNGTEPIWYASCDVHPDKATDDTGFDDYMQALLTKWKFPIASGSDAETFDQAFSNFIESDTQPDKWSTKGWLMNGPASDAPQPSWVFKRTERAETFDTSTGLFDQAFMETICDWFDFADAKINKAKWYRVEGGMSKLTNALFEYATKQGVNIVTNCPVTTLKDIGKSIDVSCSGNPHLTPPTEYAAVFSTTTFGALRRINIDGLKLSPDNLCGIRSLSYDRATKIAIKFTKPWWRDMIMKADKPGQVPTPGGVSGTDLNISNVVYPSWDDGPNTAHTLIVSYSWAQDATRMASLIQYNDKEQNNAADPLIQLCLRELVTLWSTSDYPQTVQGLQELYSAHHVFAWSHDPYSSGAFALFGPGQFEYLYTQFTAPLCGNKFSICGEAVSAHHAWISGAFDSAYNAVQKWCVANKFLDAAGKLKDSSFAGGEGFDTAESDEKLLYWQLKLAELERKGEREKGKG